MNRIVGLAAALFVHVGERDREWQICGMDIAASGIQSFMRSLVAHSARRAALPDLQAEAGKFALGLYTSEAQKHSLPWEFLTR